MPTDQPELFKAKKTRRTPAVPDPFAGSTHKLIVLYIRLYRERFSEPPQLQKLDGVTLKRLIRLCGDPDKVATRLTFFMQREDEYVRTHGGYTIRNFEWRWNDIVNMLSVQAPRGVVQCQHVPICQSPAEHTRKTIDEHRQGRAENVHFPTRSRPSDVF
jgi:hypothetical protein